MWIFIWITCSEQALQYHKALLFSDSISASAILASGNPGEQKQLGRHISDFNDKIWCENSPKPTSILHNGPNSPNPNFNFEC